MAWHCIDSFVLLLCGIRSKQSIASAWCVCVFGSVHVCLSPCPFTFDSDTFPLQICNNSISSNRNGIQLRMYFERCIAAVARKIENRKIINEPQIVVRYQKYNYFDTRMNLPQQAAQFFNMTILSD